MKFIISLSILIVLLMGCSRIDEGTPIISTSVPTFTPIPTFTLTPIPTPILVPTRVIIVDERADVIESLTLFNNTNNNFLQFMVANGDIYQLSGENPFHVAFVASKQIAVGLFVYKDAITNWTFPANSYHDRLMEIKEFELYRIQYFSSLVEMMLNTLPTENEEAVQAVQNKFFEWKEDVRNHKPMKAQNDILKELGINPDDVNFMYVIPPEESEDKSDNPVNPSILEWDEKL